MASSSPSLELPQHHNFTMAKNSNNNGRCKTAAFLFDGFLFAGGALVSFLLVYALCTFFTVTPTSSPTFSSTTAAAAASFPDSLHDPPGKNFYDYPELEYTIDSTPVKNWDEKRRVWLAQHPSFAAAAAAERILMVTGSQAAPCKNPVGDYLLLKLLKNKMDYGRRHRMEVFYNNVLLQPRMFSFWAKTAAVKAAMLAHPEAEWIWWVDSDAAFTDMDFELPLGRYKAHNMVIHGWPNLIYDKKSWTSINAGVFLIRNSQWAMDFINVWAQMGPMSADYDKWGEIQRATFKDKILPESDDQSGLAYLLLKEKEKWGDKIYLENEYYFEGYWVEIVGRFENITEEYRRVEAEEPRLRRRHAEVVSRSYGGDGGRPFITHFTGCQPCSGDHNQMYSEQSCFDAMQKALTFADNQVLRNYGFVHPDLQDPSTVKPLPFDYPSA